MVPARWLEPLANGCGSKINTQAYAALKVLGYFSMYQGKPLWFSSFGKLQPNASCAVPRGCRFVRCAKACIQSASEMSEAALSKAMALIKPGGALAIFWGWADGRVCLLWNWIGVASFVWSVCLICFSGSVCSVCSADFGCLSCWVWFVSVVWIAKVIVLIAWFAWFKTLDHQCRPFWPAATGIVPLRKDTPTIARLSFSAFWPSGT